MTDGFTYMGSLALMKKKYLLAVVRIKIGVILGQWCFHHSFIKKTQNYLRNLLYTELCFKVFIDINLFNSNNIPKKQLSPF